MADIFISYARADEDIVQRLASALEAQGWSVFWDRTIPAGQTWRSHIGKALADARCVIVAWSDDSIDSHWVHEEADDARSREVLIPVLLTPVIPPIGFRSINAANLIGWDGDAGAESFVRLRTDVSGLIGAPPALIEERERQRAESEREAAEREEKRRAEAKRKAREREARQQREAERIAREKARQNAAADADERKRESPTRESATAGPNRSRKWIGLAVAAVIGIFGPTAVVEWINRAEATHKLTVMTTPPGASVEIENVGQYEPGMRLEAGTYTIRATRAGYRAGERTIEVSERDVALEIALQPKTYELAVVTEPPGASIEIQNVGQYEPGMRLEAGTYKIRATLAGYRTAERTIEVSERDAELEIALQPATYELTVMTSPPDASIEIENVGQYEPGMRLEAGTYTIRATLAGYRAAERTIEVSERDVELEIALQPATYELTVVTSPPDASVEIENVGQYEPGMRLEAGTYTIRATLAGYWPSNRSVDVDGHDVKLEIPLEKAPPLPELVRIPAGTFMKGSEYGDPKELPVQKVLISEPFYLGATEVTFEQYDAFAEATGRELPDDQDWGRGDRPVINVSWIDAKAYTEWLGQETGNNCRLPNEAEWEYAAQAGINEKYGLPTPDAGHRDEKDGGDSIEGMANCNDCGPPTTILGDVTTAEVESLIDRQNIPAGSFEPNTWGLYNMHGNVWEWVEDCWHKNYESAPDDGSAWRGEKGGDCSYRVQRWGPWNDNQDFTRSAVRFRNSPGGRFDVVGFRVLCSSPITNTDH